MNLGEFLRQGGARSRVAGVWDCATLPADWAIERGFSDPMRAWRGAYDTEAGARALIDEAGGLERLFAAGMAEAGVPSIDADVPHEAGDVAVVRLLGEQAGALYTGARWAFVADRGFAFAALDRGCLVQLWRVGNG